MAVNYDIPRLKLVDLAKNQIITVTETHASALIKQDRYELPKNVELAASAGEQERKDLQDAIEFNEGNGIIEPEKTKPPVNSTAFGGAENVEVEQVESDKTIAFPNPGEINLSGLPVRDLQALAKENNISLSGVTLKKDIIKAIEARL